MKRVYSVILLISLLVGILQPIQPMIEYQLHSGSIVELVNSEGENAETVCSVFYCAMDDCENQQSETEQNLLDANYYPLALKITTIPDPHVFLSSTRFYLPIVKNISTLPFLPKPPPPRLR